MSRPIVIDGLNCAGMNREQMEKTKAGGVSAINYTSMAPFGGLAPSLLDLERTRAKIEAMQDIATIVRSTADIRAAHAADKVGIILGAQHSLMVEDDVALLGSFKELGLRIVQPTYNEDGRFGYGAPFEGATDKGMKEAGPAWIEEMHRQKLVIDLSHCGHKTTSDFIAAAKGPIVISHANAFAVCPSLRNKTDEHIRGVAETGGLTGAVMWSPAVRHDQRPTMDDYLDHIEHHIKIGGIDHVAFASDVVESPLPDPAKWDKSYGPNGFNPSITGVLGPWYVYETRTNVHYQSLAHTPRIWDGMRRRGYGEDAVEKVMSGNWLRVLKDVWGE